MRPLATRSSPTYRRWSTRISELAQTPYSHRYYVDGPLVAEDAQFGGAWHTVLVASLGAGGKGLFALDVTSATVNSEADAASRLLWEFTDDDYDKLGYTYARPSIVRMNNDRWAVVVGNGYMSEKGNAALLVIDVEDGSLLTAIEVEDKDDNGRFEYPRDLFLGVKVERLVLAYL